MKRSDVAVVAVVTVVFGLGLAVLAVPAAGQAPSRIFEQTPQQQATAVTENPCAGYCDANRTYPALYFKTRPLRIPPSYCRSAAKEAVVALGLANARHDAFGSGGTRGTARAFITCVTLPDSGPCNGDGASVLIAVASNQDASEATSLLQQLDDKIGDPILFDCNG